jgi:hypothetical protein
MRRPETDELKEKEMIAYAWYIWQKGWKKEPVIRWIDNQKYVIGKNDK